MIEWLIFFVIEWLFGRSEREYQAYRAAYSRHVKQVMVARATAQGERMFPALAKQDDPELNVWITNNARKMYTSWMMQFATDEYGWHGDMGERFDPLLISSQHTRNMLAGMK